MAATLRIAMFGGIVPRLADRGLPDNAAQYALNAKLYSGELRAWARLRALDTLSISNAQTVYHYRHSGLDRFLAFAVPTQVVKAPLINESLGRLYWTGAAGAKVNTTARIEAASPEYNLGVPAPGGAFTVTPTGGTAATAETRSYVAILVSAWGEESDAGAPTVASGNADGTWTIGGLDTLPVDTVNYPNITHLRLYRTLTSSTGVDYRQVAEWTLAARPASYIDAVATTTLAANPALQSLGWLVPPTGLKGLIAVAGGFCAGFTGRTVHLSVPYYPHAWPEEYSFAVEDDIVGLGSFGNTVVVCTVGRPYLLVGQTPDVMSLMKMEGVQPCLSARSIVSTSGGVTFASTDGLVLVDGGSNRGSIVTRAWVTKDEWMANYSPASHMASVYQDRYFAFYSSQLGLTIGFDDPVTGFTELQQEGVTSVDLDPLTGQTLVTIGDTVYEWDGDTTGALTYTWKSKPMQVPKPVNMGAIQLRGSFLGSSTTIPVPPAQGTGGYALNARRLHGPRDPAVQPGYGGSLNGVPAWMALGESPAPPAALPSVAVKLYADGVLRWFAAIDSERPRRLPSGYKAEGHYEIEVQGSAALFSITIADTMKALERMP